MQNTSFHGGIESRETPPPEPDTDQSVEPTVKRAVLHNPPMKPVVQPTISSSSALEDAVSSADVVAHPEDDATSPVAPTVQTNVSRDSVLDDAASPVKNATHSIEDGVSSTEDVAYPAKDIISPVELVAQTIVTNDLLMEDVLSPVEPTTQADISNDPTVEYTDPRERLDAPVAGADDEELSNYPHLKLFPEAGDVEESRIGSNWFLLGASRRGRGHSIDRKFREDDFAIRNIDHQLALVAIADGVGSCPFSRYGASASVQGAISVPKELFHKLIAEIQNLSDDSIPDTLIDEAKYILLESLRLASESVRTKAQEKKKEVSQLHSTLLVFLAIPHHDNLFIPSVQIGDGALYARQEPAQGEKWLYLQEPQIQRYTAGIVPFMKTKVPYWLKYFDASPLTEHPCCIMGMTDGVFEDVVLEPPDEFVDLERFFNGLQKGVFSQQEPIQAAQSLGNYLGYHVDGSFDDRTLVCLYRA